MELHCTCELKIRAGADDSSSISWRNSGWADISAFLMADDDDVYYYIRWRLKLEGETENMGICTKERKGVTAEVLMATPCTNSLGGESGGHRHEGCGGRSACWQCAAVSWSGAMFVMVREGGFY